MLVSLWLGSLARRCTPITDGDGNRQAESGLWLYANVVASMSSGVAFGERRLHAIHARMSKCFYPRSLVLIPHAKAGRSVFQL